MAQTGTENKKNKKMSHITSIWQGGSISFTDNVKINFRAEMAGVPGQ
jgi:hypothetical protein